MTYNYNLSIIVTTYNRKIFLGEAIFSILNQSFKDFELIIVDNFSNYDFFSFINSFKDSRIKAFQNHNNGIISVNRNYGISKASGRFLAFCDDDDIWKENKLSEQMALTKKIRYQNQLLVLHTNTILFGNDLIETRTKKRNIKNLNDFLFYNDITLSTVLLTNSQLIHFNESTIYVSSEDYNLWIELLLSGYIFELIDSPLVYYRVDNNSVSRHNTESFKHLRYLIIILTNIVKYKVRNINVTKLFFMIVYEYLKFVIRLKLKKNK